MNINLAIDTQAVLDQLKELGQERQGPFILARGLNLLAKRVQQELRNNIATSLNVRHGSWLKQQVKIDNGTWATKTRLQVVIHLTDVAAFLDKLETGGEHVPIGGRKYLAIPNSKVFGNSIIGRDSLFRIKNLNLHETPKGMEGNQRTFIIDSKNTGTPLVMQRVADTDHKKRQKGMNKKTGLRILYNLIKQSKVPKKLQWFDTATNTVSTCQAAIFTDVIQDAINKAK